MAKKSPWSKIDFKDPKISGGILLVLVSLFGARSYFNSEAPQVQIAEQRTAKTKEQVIDTNSAEKRETAVPSGDFDEKPTQPDALLCPTQTCPNPTEVLNIVLGPGDPTRLSVQQSFVVYRKSVPNCLRIGGKINLARYDRGSQATYWMGEARLVHAVSAGDGRLRLTFLPLRLSDTESFLLAPICPFPCQAIGNLAHFNANEKPYVVSIGQSRHLPYFGSGDGVQLAKLKPSQISELQTLKLPTDTSRPLVLALSEPTRTWLPALTWLYQKSKQENRRIFWYYPDRLFPELIPPPIPGIIEADLNWAMELQKLKTNLVAVSSISTKVAWGSSKIDKIPDGLFSDQFVVNSSQSSMIPVWQAKHLDLHAVRKSDKNTPMLIVGQSIVDRDAYFIARIMSVERRSNVYWYRSSAPGWEKPINYDPLPAGYEGPPEN